MQIVTFPKGTEFISFKLLASGKARVEKRQLIDHVEYEVGNEAELRDGAWHYKLGDGRRITVKADQPGIRTWSVDGDESAWDDE